MPVGRPGNYQKKKLIGLNQTIKNLNKAYMKIKGATVIGMFESVAYLRATMEVKVPTIPMDIGDLRKSWYSKLAPERSTPTKTVLEAGFSANYAAFVHEMVDGYWPNPTNWTTPGSGAKYLEIALNREAQTMIAIMKNNIQTVV